jgi:DNA-binding MarR family transcriptional regulator
MDKTSTTKAIQKLVTEGYVKRKQDLNDKRVIHLYPTDKGLHSYESIINEENKNITICFKNFSKDEKNMVTELIKKMNKNISSEWKSSKLILGGHEND